MRMEVWAGGSTSRGEEEPREQDEGSFVLNGSGT